MSVRVGLLQLRTPDTTAEALAHVAPLVREAAGQGAQLVLTPEATNILQRDRAKLAAELRPVENDAVVQGLRGLAAELGVEILVGSALVQRGEGRLANRAVLIGADGTVQATYDKIHMFDVDLPTGERWRESASYTPGEAAAVAQTAAGRLGFSICYDVRFPALYHALAQAGAELIAVPAAFTRPTGEAHWETLLRARAIETGAYVLAPAQGGLHADGRATWGRTLAVGPWGEVTGRLEDDEPGVLTVELDLAKVAAARAAIPSLLNVRSFRAPLVHPPQTAAV
jgi:deaminated glutathione amidase